MDKMDFVEKIENAFTSEQNGKIYRHIIDDTERVLIEKALNKTHGNQILAARLLGLNRNTLRSKIKKLNINKLKFKA